MSTASPQLPTEVLDVRPGDQAATTEVAGWLQALRDQPRPGSPGANHPGLSGPGGPAGRPLPAQPRDHPEDLIQTARAGLIGAIDRYNPANNRSFMPFVVACVVGELKRHLRDTSWRLHVPRPQEEQALRVCRAADDLHQTLGRAPSISELAVHLEIDEEKVLEAWTAMSTRRELSLDQPAGDDGDACLGDLVAAPGAREEPEDLLALAGLLAGLPALEREVIVLRFFQDLDQDTIAARVGFSQMHVSRLQRRALARMHGQLVEP